MKLSELLKEVECTVTRGNSKELLDAEQIEISEVVNDSRKMTKDCLFICITGASFDGHEFATAAHKQHAAAIVVEKQVTLPEDSQMAVIRCQDTRRAMALISAAYFGYPAKALKTIGITGTKGKTTTTYLIKSMLENAGHKVGLVGTIEVVIGDEHIPAVNTTPESFTLQEYFRRMVDAGCDCVVMEVSSQALMQHRTGGIMFDLGIFTNIEPDHIGPNEHKDFEEYMHCKGLLFKQCKVGIINGDDPHAKEVIEGHTCEIEILGFNEGSDLRAINLAYIHNPGELGVYFDTEGLLEMHAKTITPGRFSVYNALCAIAVARHFGCSPEEIESALIRAKVKGRIEMVKVPGHYTMMIDYAHNAMALKSLLSTIRDYRPNRLICLFGCGGNRSKLRRFEMGEVSGKLADLTIITSDNPRFEEPLDIIADIETGMLKTDGKYIKIPDRKEAIRYAMVNAQDGDIVVLAGKGHEDYQEIKGEKHHMDERELIADIIREQNLANE